MQISVLTVEGAMPCVACTLSPSRDRRQIRILTRDAGLSLTYGGRTASGHSFHCDCYRCRLHCTYRYYYNGDRPRDTVLEQDRRL